jgi:sugar lactone lactonase YvrE
MKLNYTSVLFLTLFGATAGFAQVTLNPVPSRAIGQAILIPESGNPNLVEGRELYAPQGIAVDNSASPSIVYVADTGNNRVLAWKNAASFSNGAPADLVIGQPDKYSTAPYGPGTTFSTGL